MPKRNDKRDTAKAEYIKRRRSGEKVNLKDLAEKLGVTYGTVRNWKRIDQWDDYWSNKVTELSQQRKGRNRMGHFVPRDL